MGVFVPVTEEELTRPHGKVHVQVYEDTWWPHDAEGNFYFHKMNEKSRHVSPQCNRNQAIAEAVGQKIIPGYTGVKLIEFAYVPIDVSDY